MRHACRTCLTALFLAAATAAAPLPAQPGAARLHGRVEGRTYVSPTGAFRIAIPVQPALGGNITDTAAVVTFQDEFNTHVSLACFKLDATHRRELENRGRRDYLIWFFANFVQPDFAQRFPGAAIESAHYRPDLLDGALVIHNLLPGGTMFAGKLLPTSGEPPPTAKRGNLVFVRHDRLYVISTELAEKSLTHTLWQKTPAEEDEILARKLNAIVAKITFTEPAPENRTAPSPSAAPAPPPAPSPSVIAAPPSALAPLSPPAAAAPTPPPGP